MEADECLTNCLSITDKDIKGCEFYKAVVFSIPSKCYIRLSTEGSRQKASYKATCWKLKNVLSKKALLPEI